MLQLKLNSAEYWNESTSRFEYTPAGILQLEHSLVSISKWEMKWKKPFLKKTEKSADELLDYIKCMTLNDVNESIYNFLTPKDINTISDYINDPMTATTIGKTDTSGGSGKIPTSEVIYYWMISLNIPTEFENWHLNRLLTLIQVCSIKNSNNLNHKKTPMRSRYEAQKEQNEYNKRYFKEMSKR